LRGDRADSQAFPLRHEYTFHRMLEEREFSVPSLHGYLETPSMIDTFVTGFVPGVPHFEGADDSTRDTIVDEYVQHLARLHTLDPKPFIEAGLIHPDPNENTGEELAGEPVDLEAIKRHHFAACMGNQLQFGAAVACPTLETDLMNYMQWNSETNLMATDFLGEYLGLELPEVEIPASRSMRHDVVFNQLISTLQSQSPVDESLQHQLR
jgi:hypothetical protein